MNEAAWLLSAVLCALGVTLCTKAGFGLSMIAAPSYIIHVAVSKYVPWYSQGTSEYIWQAVILVVLCCAVKKIRFRYFLCFFTSVFFGFCIDGWIWVFGGNGVFEAMDARIISFVFGELITALSVAFVFKTYLPPQMCDAVVVECSRTYRIEISKVKLFCDLMFFVLSFGLSLLLTGGFVGVGIGTVIITLINSHLIKFFGKMLDKIFVFDPLFQKAERYFLK